MKSQEEVVLTLTEDTDDDLLSPRNQVKDSTRNIVLLFTYVFRILTLVIYLFSTWFTSAYVLPFIIIISFLALDFWVIKNISGRILARLRWWSIIDESGNTRWIYESNPADDNDPHLTKRQIKIKDNRKRGVTYFWISIVAFPVLWFIMILTAVFSLKLKWAFVAFIVFAVKAVNLYGYIRCRVKDPSTLTKQAAVLKYLIPFGTNQK